MWEKLKAYEEKKASIKRQANLEEHVPDLDDGEDMLEIDGEEGVAENRGWQTSLEKGKAQATSTSTKVSSMGSNMRYGSVGSALSKRREPNDAYYTFDPALEVEKDERRRKLRQMNIKESLNKDAVARVWQDIARFWYQAGIALNAAKLKSFKIILKSIG